MRGRPVAIAAMALTIGGALLYHRVTKPPETAPRADRVPERETSARGRKSAPPLFNQGHVSSPTLETDPKAAGYDATKVTMVLNRRPAEVWGSEPRDPLWAPAMEEFATPYLERDISRLAGVTVSSVECRTAICRFEMRGPKRELNMANDILFALHMGASLGVSGDEGIGRAYYIIFPPARRDTDTVKPWYRDKRENRIPSLRDQHPELATVLPVP